MDSQKKVDESWKDAVLKEKAAASEPQPQARPARPTPPSHEEPADSEFLAFVSTLAMQALMAMGEMPHPHTQERHEDLAQARFLIDSLEMLAKKTQGNLSAEEDNEMKTLLYQLKMKFVRKEQGLPQ